MPGFAQEAPVERKITQEKISFMTKENATTIDFDAEELGMQPQASYSVLRSKFDQWLAEKAETAGAELIPGIRVDDLIVKKGKVCGVIAGEDEMEAKLVILADGVNSLLAQKIGMRDELKPDQVAVGVKEVIELPGRTIDERFNLHPNEGAAWLFAGTPSAGRVGGGFLYTNQESLSLGVVCTLSDLADSPVTVPQMLENFKAHRIIQPLIKEGKTIEYSAHLVPEGGLNMVPKLVGDGVLVVGDAAGFCINIGYAVRGMDLAVASAEAAAKAAITAIRQNDCSASSLTEYTRLLENSFVMKDLKLYSKFPQFMENPRIFNDYPELVSSIMDRLFIVNGKESLALRKKLIQEIKKAGMIHLIKDGIKGVYAL